MIGRMLMFAAMGLALAAPARAEVKEASESGFTVSHVQVVKARPDAVWAALVQPARWWSGAHSWSGKAAHLSLDPHVGGCFCERWPGGEAEHARVIFASPGKLLRLRGALGPLQGEALTGTLSFTLKPEGEGTRISVDYVVGGHARFPLKTVAPAVDGVIGEQAASLAKLVGG
ncbi:MAG: SRPBCC domain-containing protein [Sphingomonas sp.]|nr:SRPBCC domain-containing protein [Sphingomonas sp.]